MKEEEGRKKRGEKRQTKEKRQGGKVAGQREDEKRQTEHVKQQNIPSGNHGMLITSPKKHASFIILYSNRTVWSQSD